MNSLGRLYRWSLFGESHGAVVGVLVDGVPPGVAFSEADVQPALDRRRPAQSLLTTQRKEEDKVEILTGVKDGRTTGAPVLLLVRNSDTRSQDYSNLADTPRPGHSDYPARVKFKGANDARGGGMFSGRLTACTVMAGALARAILRESAMDVAAHAVRVGRVAGAQALGVAAIRATVETNPVRTAFADLAKAMEDEVLSARSAGDSVGGVVECVVEGVPAGLGEPTADSVESLLAHALFAIPAVKGVEFGDGFALGTMRGSEARDPYAFTAEGAVTTKSNHNGGALGGITTGSPLRFRVAFKPTSSIPLNQETVNLATRESAQLKVKGRHDPCIVPRAVPVVEAVAWCVLADLALVARGLDAPGFPGGFP